MKELRPWRRWHGFVTDPQACFVLITVVSGRYGCSVSQDQLDPVYSDPDPFSRRTGFNVCESLEYTILEH